MARNDLANKNRMGWRMFPESGGECHRNTHSSTKIQQSWPSGFASYVEMECRKFQTNIGKHLDGIREHTQLFASFAGTDEVDDQLISQYMFLCDEISRYYSMTQGANCAELSLALGIHLMSHDYQGVCLADLVDDGSHSVIPDHTFTLMGVTPADCKPQVPTSLSQLPDHITVVDKWLGIVDTPKNYFAKRKEVLKSWGKQGIYIATFFRDKSSAYIDAGEQVHNFDSEPMIKVMPISLDFYGIEVGDSESSNDDGQDSGYNSDDSSPTSD